MLYVADFGSLGVGARLRYLVLALYCCRLYDLMHGMGCMFDSETGETRWLSVRHEMGLHGMRLMDQIF